MAAVTICSDFGAPKNKSLPLFPLFVVVHTIKGFDIVNKAEVDVFLNSLAFSMIQWILAIAIPLLGMYPEETRIEKDTCTSMFTAALFTIFGTWKQPISLS